MKDLPERGMCKGDFEVDQEVVEANCVSMIDSLVESVPSVLMEI